MTTLLQWLLEDRASEGLGGAPNMHRMSPRFTSRQHGMSTGLAEFGALFNNDAFDFWVWKRFEETDESRYVLTIAAEDFRKLALWYLWRWAWGEWFGLRRRLYYWHLHRMVMKMRRGHDASR